MHISRRAGHCKSLMQGFSFLEIFVGIMIVMAFTLPVIHLFSQNTSLNSQTRRKSIAFQLAHHILEQSSALARAGKADSIPTQSMKRVLESNHPFVTSFLENSNSSEEQGFSIEKELKPFSMALEIEQGPETGAPHGQRVKVHLQWYYSAKQFKPELKLSKIVNDLPTTADYFRTNPDFKGVQSK